jgi:predicted nucleic acid-binding protein
VILVDTSVWVNHLKAGDARLSRLLEAGWVLAHPWVTGELALGHLSQRTEILGLLSNLPQAKVAADAEVLAFIEHRKLHGLGIGYVDAQLLTATRLTLDARLWTVDKRLAAVGSQLDLLAGPADIGGGPKGP